MAEVTDEMVTRALAVIMTPPRLQYFDDPASVARNRGIVARALLAALFACADAATSDEDRIRDASVRRPWPGPGERGRLRPAARR